MRTAVDPIPAPEMGLSDAPGKTMFELTLGNSAVGASAAGSLPRDPGTYWTPVPDRRNMALRPGSELASEQAAAPIASNASRVVRETIGGERIRTPPVPAR